MDGRTPGNSGPQVDAVALSPSPVGAETVGAAQRTHQVQAGETLSQIAERYQMSVAALAARNSLPDPDHLEIGQMLVVDAAGTTRLRLPAGESLARIQLWPWPPAQGQTLVVWMRATQPVPFALALNDQTYPVVRTEEGAEGWAFIPIGPLTAPGPRTLLIGAGAAAAVVSVPLVAGNFPTYDVPAAVTRPILGQTTKVQGEAERVNAIFAAESTVDWTPRSRFELPLADAVPHSDPFGSRRTYGGGGPVSAHAGEDFSAVPDTPVLAPAAGTVVLAEPLFVRGNAVMLDHGGGVVSGYWHLNSLNVTVGERVAAGQQIGVVGSTGLSTGAHLHWELRIRGVAVDPMQWVAP